MSHDTDPAAASVRREDASANGAGSPSPSARTTVRISPERIAALRARIASRIPDALEMLHELVSVNSYTHNIEGVNAVGEMTARRFGRLGFDSERIESADDLHGDHIVLTREGEGPPIGLISHSDTVYTAEEEAENDFGFQVVGDRIYGPGTVDIKGGTVMAWLVMDALREAAPTVFDAARWHVMINAAEEELAPDFGSLMRSRLGRDALACLVFEGCRSEGDTLHVVTRRKGMATFHIDVKGRSAHAGSHHHRGANALVQLARAIERLHGITDYEREITLNVGVAGGGTTVNRVPHRAHAHLEMRAFDPDVLEEAIDRVFQIARQEDVTSEVDGFRCRVNAHLQHRMQPWPKNDGTEHLYKIWSEAATEVGQPIASESRGGLSDGNRMWPLVPTLDGLGPHGDNLHCAERDPERGKEPEYVTRSSFEPRALLNAVAICRLVEGAEGGVGDRDAGT